MLGYFSAPIPVGASISTSVVLLYLGLTKILRHRRTKKLTKRLGYEKLTEADIYEKINLPDAHEIVKNLFEWEFPKFFEVALQFALFRTYAIPTVSAILAKTRQLSDPKPSPKRYVDTVVLIAEFTRWPLDSERASQAIARMNFLHSQHSSIRPIDTLYTLILFATQPIIFISRYEWRQPTELEKAAMWKFWTEVGIRMKIPPETIPKTFDAMVEWCEEFEKESMVPTEINNLVGRQTVELLLFWVPNGPIKRFGKQCVYGIVDERLRKAMIFPKPHWVVPYILRVVLGTRKFYLRHLALPRITKSSKLFPNPNPKTGLYNAVVPDVEPWYTPVTFWNRWGPWAWYARIGGWPVVEEGRFMSGGYDIVDVGPKGFSGKGRETVLADAQRIRDMGVGGGSGSGGGTCPFR